MVNGQLLHENDKPTADLVLERIELKSAVLIYKGYRYRISY
jgi:general secretion pathway protein B